MRTYPIHMTKAAMGRLSLLRDAEALPIPLDPEMHSPFGLRFSEQTLCLTYQGADVAYVPEEARKDGKGFDLRVLLPPSEVVDRALTRAFARMTQHLDQAGRILAQEKREEKVRTEAEAAEALRLRLEAPNPMVPFLSKNQQRPHRDARSPVEGITGQEAEKFLWALSASDPFPLYWDQYNGGRIRYTPPEDAPHTYPRETRISIGSNDTVYLHQDLIGLDMAALTVELKRRVERGRRILVEEEIVKAVAGLATSPFQIERYVMAKPDKPKLPTGVLAELENGVSVVAHQHTITLMREECPIWNIAVYGQKEANPRWIPWGPMSCMNLSMMRREAEKFAEPLRKALGSEGLGKLGGLWLEALVAANPDLDASLYRAPDLDRLTLDAEQEDAGYAF